ncbi:MAG TPA: hypothetical protein VFF27_06750 [Bacteroidia bacterium]|jgi:hypothetical protein|nr:hypothetical protein [Bacteroidia bacterium]
MKKKGLLLIFIGIHFSTLAQNGYLLSGARASALGTASVALNDEWGVIHNQAGLGFVRQTTTGFYYENRFQVKELGLRSALCVVPLKHATLGTSFTNFGFQAYKENKFNLAFAKALSNTFSMGIAIDYLHTSIAEYTTRFTTLVGEIGIQKKLTTKIILGAHVYNPTRSRIGKNTSDRIPTIMRFGGCYQISPTLIILAETEKDLKQKPVFKAGMEYQPHHCFVLRTGLHTNPLVTSFGFGFQHQQLKLDFSGNYHQTLGYTTQIGFIYSFSKKEESGRKDL